METEEYRQLEEQLKTAGSYQGRSAIRNKMRELRRGAPSRVPTVNDENAVQKSEPDSLLRPKSAIVTNGFNSSAPQLENGFRKSYTPVSNSKDIKMSKNTLNDSSSTDHLSHNKLSRDSNDLKKGSRPVGNKILTTRTPPVTRKEPLKTDDGDGVGSRRRARTLDSVDTGPEAIIIQHLSKQQIQHCLTDYVNRELRPTKKILPNGESLYLVSADPRILCRLINASKKNTVDMRCLTDISDNATDADIKIAVEENMTLAVESARSIGCHITEEDVMKIIHHDADTIHKILLKILQARVIDFNGMDELPSWYFSEPSFLFDKLNITIPEDPANTSNATSTTTTTTSPNTTTATNTNTGTTSTPSAANRNTDSSPPAISATTAVSENSPPAPNKLTTSKTTNNIKKHSAQETYRNTNKEDFSSNSESGIKVRRVRSDAPPNGKEKPENKNLTNAGVRGLTASFEKFQPTTGPKSTGAQPRIDPAQNEIRRDAPNTSTRPHRNTTFTKSNDFVATEPVESIAEKEKLVVRTPSFSETQSLPMTTRSEIISDSPYSSPKRSYKSLEPSAPQESPYRRKKSESSDDLLDADPTLSMPPQLNETRISPQNATKALSIESDESTSKATSSPNSSTSNSETVTPLDSNEKPLKDTDEYLLTLDERDPSLTYEQRKQIRKLKRLRKQTESKK